MKIPIFLAHGALGGFDEVIMIGVSVVFVVMMGVSWVKSRSMEPLLEEEEPAEPNVKEPTDSMGASNEDRFPLD